MSSEFDASYLSSADLKILQQTLEDAGYSGDVSVYPPAQDYNVAARLLIRLFQQGIQDPVALGAALGDAFGRTESVPAVDISRSFNRYAIQGVQPLQGRRLPAVHEPLR